MNFFRNATLLVFGATLSLAQGVPAIAFIQTTGMVGIADGETARLNVLNPGAVAPAMGMVCTAQLSFFDDAGNSIKSATVTVTPGKTAALDLRSDTDLALLAGDRKEIRAVITLPATPGATAISTARPSCRLIPTLEVFDTASGRTLVLLGHVAVVP